MMSDTFTREERRSALDEFARVGTDDEQAMLPVPVTPPQAMQVFGAQAVAVRRDEVQVLSKLKVLAAAAGDDWYYRFPVKNRKDNRTDWIEGPSIKLANDLARLYGNCEVDCRAQDMGGVIMYHARFLDLETGYALTRPFQQRKGASKLGGGDAARAEDITFQIGASKAIRNCVVNALQTFADYAFTEAKGALVDKVGKRLEEYRERTVERLGAKVDIVRVEAVVGRTADQWLAPDIAKIIAMGKACEDGMASWDETFPPLRAPNEKTDTALDAFAKEPESESAAGSGLDVGTGSTQADDAESRSNPTAASSVSLQRNVIDTCLRLAVNPQLTPQERLERLDNIEPAFDGVPETFVKTVVKTAADVVSGKIKNDAARRYLEGMVK